MTKAGNQPGHSSQLGWLMGACRHYPDFVDWILETPVSLVVADEAVIMLGMSIRRAGFESVRNKHIA